MTAHVWVCIYKKACVFDFAPHSIRFKWYHALKNLKLIKVLANDNTIKIDSLLNLHLNMTKHLSGHS